jgi:hypothetical protein
VFKEKNKLSSEIKAEKNDYSIMGKFCPVLDKKS